jgi:hypothetical protein
METKKEILEAIHSSLNMLCCLFWLILLMLIVNAAILSYILREVL